MSTAIKMPLRSLSPAVVAGFAGKVSKLKALPATKQIPIPDSNHSCQAATFAAAFHP